MIWMDSRYGFTFGQEVNSGGLTLVRTNDKVDADRKYLKEKWGAAIRFKKVRTTTRTFINVRRRQTCRIFSDDDDRQM